MQARALLAAAGLLWVAQALGQALAQPAVRCDLPALAPGAVNCTAMTSWPASC
jgi:hypothetical protein